MKDSPQKIIDFPSSSHCILVAGGTGGHIHSALRLGEVFKECGLEVQFWSGTRPLDYRLMPKDLTTHFSARPLVRSKKILNHLWNNFRVFLSAYKKLKQKKPCFILGTGGYICGPTLLAGKLLKIPVFILEQNSVMGLTNRLLMRFIDKAFTHFRVTSGTPSSQNHKLLWTGNPIFSQLASVSPYLPSKETFNILVFGGSLGAKEINQWVEGLISSGWGGDYSQRFQILHQVGGEESGEWQELAPKIRYKRVGFIDKMWESYSWANLVVCRGGATTISELRVVKRPAVIIPYPYHADNHQRINGEGLAKEVDFPVFIETVTNLERDKFAYWSEIVEKVMHYAPRCSSGSLEDEINRPVHRIVIEVAQYVFA